MLPVLRHGRNESAQASGPLDQKWCHVRYASRATTLIAPKEQGMQSDIEYPVDRRADPIEASVGWWE
jgi:hypothetical protein